MTGICKLCAQDKPLLLSHITPAFVFKWARDTAGGSHLRSTAEPNLRAQDGLKYHWLCADCETLFSKDERTFAYRLFHPYLENSAGRYPYGPWLLRFCTSVSWRLLHLTLERGQFEDDWTTESIAHLRHVETIWREYLLGARLHPGQYRQHILPLDIIQQATDDTAPNINRYLARAIQTDLCRNSQSTFTLAKLGRFAVFGMIQPDVQPWKGTIVRANEGTIEPKKYVLPSTLWSYFNQKANEAGEAIAAVSDKQHAKIDENFRKNIDHFPNSDSFRAMQADVEMFGDRAFRRSKQ